ncbi:MAG TPA: hypothetical protein QF753_14015 [Victivallales bacterium]|nr:hypothetical protein [Victivallales bacterium]
MNDIFKNELIAFLNLSDKLQFDILDEFNGDSPNSIGIFDIVPQNIDKNAKLQDFVKFLTLTRERHNKKQI